TRHSLHRQIPSRTTPALSVVVLLLRLVATTLSTLQNHRCYHPIPALIALAQGRQRLCGVRRAEVGERVWDCGRGDAVQLGWGQGGVRWHAARCRAEWDGRRR